MDARCVKNAMNVYYNECNLNILDVYNFPISAVSFMYAFYNFIYILSITGNVKCY